MLLVLDASRSMNAPSGDGSGDSRLDAAKAAVGEVLDTVPDDAPLGPARVRRAGGEPGAREGVRGHRARRARRGRRPGAVRAAVQALTGKGRTPIGRSLLATPGDFAGDDRAPPGDPRLRRPRQLLAAVAVRGRAARVAARRGAHDLGRRLRARRRARGARCSASRARAAAPTSTRTTPTRCARELLAAFARAFRSYEPAGTPVEGGARPGRRAAARRGAVPRGAARPGDVRDYTVSVGPGQRLLVSVTSIPDRATEGSGTLRADLTGRDGPVVTDEFVDVDGDVSGQYGQIDTISLRAPQAAAPGDPERRAPRATTASTCASRRARSTSGRCRSSLGPGARPGRGAGQGERARAAARAGRHAAAVGDARGDAAQRARRRRRRRDVALLGASAAAGWSSACSRAGRRAGAAAGEARRRAPRSRSLALAIAAAPAGAVTRDAGRGRRLVRRPPRCSSRGPTATRCCPPSACSTGSASSPASSCASAAMLDSRTTRTTTPTTRSRRHRDGRCGRSRCSRTSSATSPATARSTTATRASPIEFITPPAHDDRRRGSTTSRTYRGPGIWYVSLYLPTQDAKPRRREFPVALELEVVGEPQDDASPDPTPAPSAPRRRRPPTAAATAAGRVRSRSSASARSASRWASWRARRSGGGRPHSAPRERGTVDPAPAMPAVPGAGAATTSAPRARPAERVPGPVPGPS